MGLENFHLVLEGAGAGVGVADVWDHYNSPPHPQSPLPSIFYVLGTV